MTIRSPGANYQSGGSHSASKSSSAALPQDAKLACSARAIIPITAVNLQFPLLFKDFQVRPWQPHDRQAVADLIATALAEYGLGWEPVGADRDVLEVETAYRDRGGAFWVVERDAGSEARQIVGTAAYYPIERSHNAVEIRKMYLHADVRGQGLGRFLLTQLEATIAQKGFQEIWIETATILAEAVILYERSGYQLATGVETHRCDRVYRKSLQATP
jgi:putative acetyltransferase